MIIDAFIWLFVVALIAGILLHLVSIAPFITPPIKQFLTFALYALCALLLIAFLLSIIGVVDSPFPALFGSGVSHHHVWR